MPTFSCNGTATGTGTIQTWTVPTTGPYRIRAVGAQGGNASNGYTGLGGRGADMTGTFSLTAGQVLDILVGQQPAINGSVRSNGGGGGTFVVIGGTPLIVAGGGSGGYSGNGVDARTTYTSSNGSTTAAGGAGFSTNGAGDSWVSGTAVAYAYVNGGKGGGPGSYSNYGGYGGGAATHGWDGTYYCGGGGYQGGDSNLGLGAGSYNSGTNQTNSIYTGTGNGFVEITLLNVAPSAPTGAAVKNGMYAVRRAKASWTHVDSDGDPQSKYQLRWRAYVATAAAVGLTEVDTTTQGNWVDVYGLSGYRLYAWTAPATDIDSLPALPGITESGVTRYRWGTDGNVRSLMDPGMTARSAACVYSATSMTLTLTPATAFGGYYRAYILDYDAGGRTQTMTLTIGGSSRAYSASGYSLGQWISWPVSCPAGTPITLTVANTGPANAVVSAIMLDAA